MKYLNGISEEHDQLKDKETIRNTFSDYLLRNEVNNEIVGVGSVDKKHAQYAYERVLD